MSDDDDYAGPATLVLGDRELAVDVVLRGQFEPIDGRYHWYGRISAHPELTSGAATVRTEFGAAEGQLSDPDTWGRYRITGTGRPPFPVATSLSDVEHH